MLSSLPELFKGIALFTPGGDVIYSIDPSKQAHWHTNLCSAWQEILQLPEPPHFLIPGYTATIERWRDDGTGELHTVAELYPPVKRYQALLNALFSPNNELVWEIAPWGNQSSSMMIVHNYRETFSTLWENHDLIVPFPRVRQDKSSSYILRLFVAGNTKVTQQIMQIIHQILEEKLQCTYTLKVVDIAKHPEQAELYQVSATPTLIRLSPEPVKRIVGEWQDPQKIIQILTS